jgi:hypothetical protein
MAPDRNNAMFTLPIRISLFLLSAATLVFEINLSRLFSVAQFYHFAFMIVSLALLGFGASGSYLSIKPNTGRRRPALTVAILALGASLSILGSYILINRLPFDSFSIAWDPRQIFILTLHYLVLALPFFFSGLAVGMLFNLVPGSAGLVYAHNLTGSAVGCLVALAAPALLGGEGTVVLSSALAALAGIISAPRIIREAFKVKAVFVLAGTLMIFNIYALAFQIRRQAPLPIFALDISPYKSLSYARQYPGAELLSQRWNAFSRVDVVSSPGIRSLPGVSFRYTNPPPAEHGVFVDGDNLRPVVLPQAQLDFSAYLPAAIAYELRPEARALILEPGGGLDLLTAIDLGAAGITAVEPNPLILEPARHIYGLPEVEAVSTTGRSYLRRSQEKFDLIIFSLTDSYHPVRSGAYSLAEDYRYTLEAFTDALESLDESGILVTTRWLQVPPSEWLRAFTLSVNALEAIDLEPEERIAALRSFNTGLLLIKRASFTREELELLRNFADKRAFDLVYLPDLQPEETNRFSILEEPLYYQAFREYLEAPSRGVWLAAYPYDVSPPTDNHPFFGHYFKWSQAPQIIAELGKSWQPFGGAGYFVLLVLLGMTFVLALAIILLPLAVVRRTTPLPGMTATSLAYFGALGLAFLLVEIPLIQRLILYLGHPAHALTTTLFAILLFSGIGSRYSHRLPLRGSLAVLIAAALVGPWLYSIIFSLTLGFPLPVRLVIAAASLAPLGFLMGIPFPRGIQALESKAPGLIPWAWGVNGALSVIASILAALIALSFGFSWTLLAGAACYAGALAAAGRFEG